MNWKILLPLFLLTLCGVVAVFGPVNAPKDTFPWLTCRRSAVINNEMFRDTGEFLVPKLTGVRMMHEVDLRQAMKGSIVCCGTNLNPVTLTTISLSATKLACTGLTSLLDVNQTRILQKRCEEGCWTPVQHWTLLGTGYFEVVAPIESLDEYSYKARCELSFHSGSGHINNIY